MCVCTDANCIPHIELQVQSKGVCDGVLQCRKKEKIFSLLCSLGRPLYQQLEAGGRGGGGGGSGGQGKKEKGL